MVMSKNFKILQEQVAEKLIAALKEGTSPFQKPWTDDNSSGYITPLNPTTGKNYRGMNAFWLAMHNYDDPRWLTFKQAAANKWSVKKGEKSTMITYVKKFDARQLMDERGKPVRGPDGKPVIENVKLDKPMFINALVFNAAQITGIPPWQQALDAEPERLQWSAIERAEQIIRSSQAVIKHGGNEAYYAPSRDLIQLPKKEQFDTAAKYYATLLHELGHWSGHETRLNRDLRNKYGSPAYAKEELRAEIASLMMGSELNIGHNFGQHAAYVGSWIKVLEDDPAELFKASADAQRITDYLLEFERKIELPLTKDQAVADKLVPGDVISYNGTSYEVLGSTANKAWQIRDTITGAKIKLHMSDGLYHSLLNAKAVQAEQVLIDDLRPDTEQITEARVYE
jgi:antirestriction protein ArdC